MRRYKGRPHPFRFVRRTVGGARIYYVIYDVDPSRRISTGIPVDERDGGEGGPGYEAAVSWAYANGADPRAARIALREATVDMFTERCGWRRRVSAKGRRFSSKYFYHHRNRLERYVWPRFGHLEPARVTAAHIDAWLLDLHGVSDGRELTPHAKNKVLQTLRKVFDELEYQGIITQAQNPARLVEYFTDKSKKREPITLDEFHRLFPENVTELTRIWGTLPWATYFYTMATTGLRPGEVGAIDLRYWIPGVGYAVAQAVDPATRELKGLKTSEKGVAVKPAYFNDRLESLLELLLSRGAAARGLLFPGSDGRPMPPETSNKHFKASCSRVRPPIELAGRTQYSLRHFYSTVIAKHLTEDEAALYLGQRTYLDDYDHRTVLEKLKDDVRMRDLSNRLF